MDKIRLGRSGLLATKIGLGGIPIQRLGTADAVRVICHCLDLGVNLIDTAFGYTTSEERIGMAISGRRQDVILASKSPATDRAGFLAHLDVGLQRLGVELETAVDIW